MGRHSANRPAVPVPAPRQPTTGRTRAEERALAARAARSARPAWRRYHVVPAVVTVTALAWTGGDLLGLVNQSAPALAHPAAAAAIEHTGSLTVIPPAGDTSDGYSLPTTSGLAASSADAAPALQRVSRATRDPADLMLDAGPLQKTVIAGKTVSGTWVRPSSGAMSSCFCMRWGTMHEGIDLAAPMNSPIVAAGDGVVIEAGPAEGFGHWVVIQHSNGDVSIYGHMYTVLVTVGQKVKAGELIARVGEDGEATGPHLHFGVRKGGLNGPYLDPVPWLKARGVSVGSYDPNA